MRTGGFPYEDPAATAPWEPAYPSDWLTCSECGIAKESVYAHSPVCDECHAEGRPRERVFWEPVTFKVGDRVRVHPGPECRVPVWPKSIGAINGVIAWVHDDPGVTDGMTGVIVDPFEWYSNVETYLVAEAVNYYTSRGHPYDVIFDVPIRCPLGLNQGGMFAAAELELLTEGDGGGAK